MSREAVDGMLQACRDGDMADMLSYVRNNVSVNCKNEYGVHPLHAAAEYGHLSLVKELVSLGALVPRKTMDGESAEDLARFNKHPHVAYFLRCTQHFAQKNISQTRYAPQPRRLALLIGNEDGDGRVPHALSDVEVMGKRLKKLSFDVFARTNLGTAEMNDVFETFAKQLQPNDFVLFFFTGMGCRQGKRSLLFGVDKKFMLFPSHQKLAVEDVVETLLTRQPQKSRASFDLRRRKEIEKIRGPSVVIVDACRSSRATGWREKTYLEPDVTQGPFHEPIDFLTKRHFGEYMTQSSNKWFNPAMASDTFNQTMMKTNTFNTASAENFNNTGFNTTGMKVSSFGRKGISPRKSPVKIRPEVMDGLSYSHTSAHENPPNHLVSHSAVDDDAKKENKSNSNSRAQTYTNGFSPAVGSSMKKSASASNSMFKIAGSEVLLRHDDDPGKKDRINKYQKFDSKLSYGKSAFCTGTIDIHNVYRPGLHAQDVSRDDKIAILFSHTPSEVCDIDFPIPQAKKRFGPGADRLFSEYANNVEPVLNEYRMHESSANASGTHLKPGMLFRPRRPGNRCAISRSIIKELPGAPWPAVLGWENYLCTTNTGEEYVEPDPSLFVALLAHGLGNNFRVKDALSFTAAKVIEFSDRIQKPCLIERHGDMCLL